MDFPRKSSVKYIKIQNNILHIEDFLCRWCWPFCHRILLFLISNCGIILHWCVYTSYRVDVSNITEIEFVCRSQKLTDWHDGSIWWMEPNARIALLTITTYYDRLHQVYRKIEFRRSVCVSYTHSLISIVQNVMKKCIVCMRISCYIVTAKMCSMNHYHNRSPIWKAVSSTIFHIVFYIRLIVLGAKPTNFFPKENKCNIPPTGSPA